MVVQKYSGIIKIVRCYIMENHLNWALAPEGTQERVFAVCGGSAQLQPPGSHGTNQRLTHPGLSAVGLHLQLCWAAETTTQRETQALPVSMSCVKTKHQWNICVCDAKTCPKLLCSAGSLQEASPGRGCSGLGWKQQVPNVKGALGWVEKGRQSCKVLEYQQREILRFSKCI